jgi:hypothetical protein
MIGVQRVERHQVAGASECATCRSASFVGSATPTFEGSTRLHRVRSAFWSGNQMDLTVGMRRKIRTWP